GTAGGWSRAGIVEHVPEQRYDAEGPRQLQITTVDYRDCLGLVSIGRVAQVILRSGDRVLVAGREGDRVESVRELFTFDKLGRTPAEVVQAGDICAVTGLGDVEIGDTITDIDRPCALPRITVDQPTLSMVFQVNDGPFAGQDGKFVTSRQLRDRLYKELESNVALRVADMSEAGRFEVSGRGTLHLGILIENMRREGYEFLVGKPRPIFREIDGVRHEPIELLVCNAPENCAGKVIEVLGARRGEMIRYEPSGERVHLEFKVPARGLIGMGSRLLNITGGEAVIYHNFHSYEPHKGSIPSRQNGVMVSVENGVAIPYALFNLKDRGPMFVSPGDPVYEGMIVGEHCKDDDIGVNVCKTKKLTNIRADGKDKNVLLS